MSAAESTNAAEKDLAAITRCANMVRRAFMYPPLERMLACALAYSRGNACLSKLAPNHYQYPNPSPRIARRNGVVFDLNIAEYHDWRVYFSKPSPALVRLLSYVRPGDVVLDIGANIGEFALMAAQCCGPGGRVFAFEPFPPNIARLRKNADLNPGLPLQIMPYALSDAAGLLTMKVTDGQNFGTACVRTDDSSANALQTQSTPLDDLDLGVSPTRVSFVKIDVEGWEMHVLRGAEKFLNAARPRIAAELADEHLKSQGTSARELVAWFRDHQFELRDVMTGRPLDANEPLDGCERDVLAIPEEKAGAGGA